MTREDGTMLKLAALSFLVLTGLLPGSVSAGEFLPLRPAVDGSASGHDSEAMADPILIREGSAPERRVVVSGLEEAPIGYIGDHLLVDSRGKIVLWDEYTGWRRRKAFGRLREDERYVHWNHGSRSIGIVQRKFDYRHDQY